ncbi:TetR/AcrR family transcriptional regulator [Rhodococcus erythropolis]|uniref:TetR/AcrR family transcriptional regulator n=1 Tax=Rhodococcus erythropolis TaxID=1833 RepID=UPI001C9AED0C|nr:TetR/AcrR family transcriptional regulator [Rhodococcus erythropolis]MBY6382339.1 TetR/AcrR family transcriptional regulator [Rhodococcus erythropolis]
MDSQTDSDVAATGAPTTRRTSRRAPQQRAIATRDGIASAAAEHFNTVGYAGARIADIVATTGDSKGGMYHHFRSKESLAQYLVHRWGTVLVVTVADVTAGDGPALHQVASVQRALAAIITHDHVARAGLLLSLERAVDESAKVYTAWTSVITVIVEQAMRTGQLDDTAEHSRLAETLCTGFVGAVHVATRLGEPDTISRRVDDLLTLWLGRIETTVAAGAGEVP